MKFSISKHQLDKAIDRVSKALDNNPFLPALKGVMVEANDSAVNFTVSNHEISVKHTVFTTGSEMETFNRDGCEINEAGSALIPLTLFKNIVKRIDGIIKIETKDTVLKITTEDDRFEMNLLDTTEYPEIDFEQYGEKITLNFEVLKDIVKNVSFAASQNSSVLILSCVNISSKNGTLVAVATDSYRLAREQAQLDNNSNFNISILAKSLKDLLNFDLKGDIDMFVSERKIHINYDNSIIQAKLVNLAYKDVSGIIPKQFDQVLSIERKHLSELIQKASLMNTENNSKIHMVIDNGILKISAVRDEVGKAEIKTNDFSYNDDSLDIILSTRNLTDAINVFDGKINIMFAQNKQRIVVVSKSHPTNVQLLTPQKGYY